MKRINEDSEISISARARKEGLRRIPRRHGLEAGEAKLTPAKVRVTMYLDSNVLEYFKRKAAEPNAAPYQTQINNELRKVVENKPASAAEAMLHDIVDNRSFMLFISQQVIKEIAVVAARSRKSDFSSFVEELLKNVEDWTEKSPKIITPSGEPEWSR